jgi:outer membrane protein assembly factor BamE
MRLTPANAIRCLTRGLAAVLFASLASGCVYRMTIQQGNFLEKRTVDQLQVGMTRSQVRYLLGTPMVPTLFDSDRWDYLYYLRKGHLEKVERRDLTVFFDNDKVARFESRGNAPANSESVVTEPPLRPAT